MENRSKALAVASLNGSRTYRLEQRDWSDLSSRATPTAGLWSYGAGINRQNDRQEKKMMPQLQFPWTPVVPQAAAAKTVFQPFIPTQNRDISKTGKCNFYFLLAWDFSPWGRLQGSCVPFSLFFKKHNLCWTHLPSIHKWSSSSPVDRHMPRLLIFALLLDVFSHTAFFQCRST